MNGQTTESPTKITLMSYIWIILGLITFLSGVVIFLNELFGYSEHKKRIDTYILKEWDEITSTEYFDDFFTNMEDNHKITFGKIDELNEWIDFHDKENNKLKNKYLKEMQIKLVEDLRKISTFIFEKFDNSLFHNVSLRKDNPSNYIQKLAPEISKYSPYYQELEKEL